MTSSEMIYLAPGACFFGDDRHRVRTLLGSCVAVTFWHPASGVGGMSHIMLPSRGPWGARYQPAEKCEEGCRYADGAIAHMLRWLKRRGLAPRDVQVKVFGGGKTLAQNEPIYTVGERNIEAVTTLLKQLGFEVRSADLGGIGHRVLVFDLATGHVWVKRVRHKLGDG